MTLFGSGGKTAGSIPILAPIATTQLIRNQQVAGSSPAVGSTEAPSPLGFGAFLRLLADGVPFRFVHVSVDKHLSCSDKWRESGGVKNNQPIYRRFQMRVLSLAACVLLLVSSACTDYRSHPAPIAAPTFLAGPEDAMVPPGETATFTVSVQSAAPVSITWERSGLNSEVWTVIDGRTTNTLIVPDVTTALAGSKYRCLATNPGGTTVSNAATLSLAIQ